MAGRLRLAATGVQDQWLTGEPQFSYFLMNFKKHTKFAIDTIESQFDGKIDFDQILDVVFQTIRVTWFVTWP